MDKEYITLFGFLSIFIVIGVPVFLAYRYTNKQKRIEDETNRLKLLNQKKIEEKQLAEIEKEKYERWLLTPIGIEYIKKEEEITNKKKEKIKEYEKSFIEIGVNLVDEIVKDKIEEKRQERIRKQKENFIKKEIESVSLQPPWEPPNGNNYNTDYENNNSIIDITSGFKGGQ